jgi:predicted O-methyltransferase YrrM
MKKTLKEILQECHLNIWDEVNLKIDPNYGTDKGEPKSYIDEYYEENFKKYREKEITLVEIGVRSGASLKLWSEYFCKEAKIYGLDNLYDKNNHSVPINEDWVSADNVEYIIGDAYTEEICNEIGKIDVLIDDGPHTFESHVKLLELYTSKMNPGGVIVIEDISYDPNLIYNNVPDYLKETSYVCDYGNYDDRLIIIGGFN